MSCCGHPPSPQALEKSSKDGELLRGVLAPSARSQELPFPGSLAGRELICDSVVTTVEGQGVEGPWLTGVTAWVCSWRPPFSGNANPVWPHPFGFPPKAPNPDFGVKPSFETSVTNSKSVFKNHWANRTYLQVIQNPWAAIIQPLYQELVGLGVWGWVMNPPSHPSFLPHLIQK